MIKATVKPNERMTSAPKTQSKTLDLSEFEPRTLDVARDEDGRVYRVVFTPRIDETPEPRQFHVEHLRLESWAFSSSPIIVNDQEYFGRIGMNGANVASCDIPGVAKVEFSLLPLKGAKPWGTLQKGVLNITHKNGTTIRISDVKNGNGKYAEVLAAGPYRVWVRWTEPTQSAEENRKSMLEYIASLRKQVEAGELWLPPGRLQEMEQRVASGHVVVGSSLRDAEPDELVEAGE